MKKAEFIAGFTEQRRTSYKAEVKAGKMRPSEAAMGLASADQEAAKLWRKHSGAFRNVSAKELFPVKGAA